MFSAGVERALRVAFAAHEGQVRKGRDPVPYVLHPVHVAIMLARLGMDEAVVQAGVLHDVVEDCEGWTVERIEADFGARVAGIVGELTEDKSKSWDERKQAAVDHVAHMSEEAAAVKACDKLHNLQSLLAALESAEDASDVWSRFRGGRERTLEMAERLVAALETRLEPRIVGPLRETLTALTASAGAASGA